MKIYRTHMLILILQPQLLFTEETIQNLYILAVFLWYKIFSFDMIKIASMNLFYICVLFLFCCLCPIGHQAHYDVVIIKCISAIYFCSLLQLFCDRLFPSNHYVRTFDLHFLIYIIKRTIISSTNNNSVYI